VARSVNDAIESGQPAWAAPPAAPPVDVTTNAHLAPHPAYSSSRSYRAPLSTKRPDRNRLQKQQPSTTSRPPPSCLGDRSTAADCQDDTPDIWMIHAESSYDRPLRLVVPFFILHLISFFSLRSAPRPQHAPQLLRLPVLATAADQPLPYGPRCAAPWWPPSCWQGSGETRLSVASSSPSSSSTGRQASCALPHQRASRDSRTV
jgi:hypothetical protein